MEPVIQSNAFRDAALRSERYRTIGLLIIIGGFVLMNIIRCILIRADAPRYLQYVGFWSACGIYEAVILAQILRAQRRGTFRRSWLPLVNTIVECSFPTISALGLTMDKSYLGPYLALASGILILYCFFIILSTLRLSPALSLLAGVVSCGGYLSVYALTVWAAPKNVNRAVFPPEALLLNGFLLLAAGVIAAGVARQIRQHVIAALNEADARLKLDRVEHDLQIARTIQMGLLPKKPPAASGYDIAGWSQPADQTGGDYYDWMELPGGRILFTIADAAGHGIGPALLVAACRAYFRALATQGDPLETITRQVDALLAADVPAGRFITAAVALLEPEAHRVSLYSAGHAPLYFLRSAGAAIELLDADQPPLGVQFDDGTPTKARVLALLPGDGLILVTDGFFECANRAGEQLGMENFGAAIRKHHGLKADVLIAQLHEEVRLFSQGAPQADDLTAVVIRRLG